MRQNPATACRTPAMQGRSVVVVLCREIVICHSCGPQNAHCSKLEPERSSGDFLHISNTRVGIPASGGNDRRCQERHRT